MQAQTSLPHCLFPRVYNRVTRTTTRDGLAGYLLVGFLFLIVSAAPAVAQGGLRSPYTDSLAIERQRLELQKLRVESRYADSLASLQLSRLQAENENAKNSGTDKWFTRIPVVLAVLAGILGFFRYLWELYVQGKRRDEERLEQLARDMGSERSIQRVQAAVLLPTYVRRRRYRRFHRQIFNLTAGGLRMVRSIPDGADAPDNDGRVDLSISSAEPGGMMLLVLKDLPVEKGAAAVGEFDSDARTTRTTPKLPDPLVQTLASVFREVYPIVRDSLDQRTEEGAPDTETYLDASGIKLDSAYLGGADLNHACLRQASLKETNLGGALLKGAILENSVLIGANLTRAHMNGANMQGADLSRAVLTGATLHDVKADRVSFRDADMVGIMVGRPELPEGQEDQGWFRSVDFSGADLGGAKFYNVRFGASPGTDQLLSNPEKAKNLRDAEFVNSIGLTDEQKSQLRARNAKILPIPPAAAATQS